MSLKEALESGLNGIPGCRTVCYVDMPSGLVLSSCSRRPRPQEVLDGIASLATKLFQSDGLAAVADAASDARQFIVFGRTDARIFIQAANEPEHALCYVCDLSVDPDEITNAVVEHRQHVAEKF